MNVNGNEKRKRKYRGKLKRYSFLLNERGFPKFSPFRLCSLILQEKGKRKLEE